MTSTRTLIFIACTLALVCATATQNVQAGCPFDDGSCQEYCNQQGCNLGYCGHFAWIQCICRKCGDEWNWYDKVHYNPDKQVNQTELDSLKLNGSAPLILTNNNAKRLQPQEMEGTTPALAAAAEPQVFSNQQKDNQARSAVNQQQQQQQQQATSATARQQEQKVPATLTTLLIPDLSDGSKLDLNDIPDENSEKFLDYLTKNHEKLVQATNQKSSSSARSASQENDNESKANDDETDSDDTDAEQVTTPNTSSDAESQADEAIEIQISSSDNSQPSVHQQSTTTTTTTTTASTSTAKTTNNKSGGARSLASNDDAEASQQQASGQMMRLLRMAVAERSSDDIF